MENAPSTLLLSFTDHGLIFEQYCIFQICIDTSHVASNNSYSYKHKTWIQTKKLVKKES